LRIKHFNASAMPQFIFHRIERRVHAAMNLGGQESFWRVDEPKLLTPREG
jgi:hypothetical protein